MKLKAILLLFVITIHSLSYCSLTLPDQYKKELNTEYNKMRADYENLQFMSGGSLQANINKAFRTYGKDLFIMKAIELSGEDEDLALMLVCMVIHAGANIDSQIGTYKYHTPLMLGVIKNYPRVVKLLLNSGANLTLKNENQHDVFELSDKAKTVHVEKSVEVNALLHDYKKMHEETEEVIANQDPKEINRVLMECVAKDYAHLAKILIYELSLSGQYPLLSSKKLCAAL